jgi:ribosomal protein S12 methylthiotransferase accessory factor YcaO
MWERVTSPCDDPVLFDDLPRHVTRGLGEDLELLLDKLAGAQVIAVDLTHPVLRVPVVKVLVPGRAIDLEVLG